MKIYNISFPYPHFSKIRLINALFLFSEMHW